MDSVKNRGRNKFSTCFNATVVEEAPYSGTDEDRRRKKMGRHSLFYFVKAIFFKTPLLKKLRNKRSKRDDSYRSNTNISSKLKRLTKKRKTQPSKKILSDPEEIYIGESSDRSSLFSSTSLSRPSSISSVSSSGSERMKASSNYQDLNPTSTNDIRQHAMKLLVTTSKCDCKGLMFIVLVCLVALVFWGKVFAIVTCTSAWLFLAPGRAGPQGVGPRADNIVDSDEYKKRVIMDGLLERNIRSRVVVQ